MRSVFPGELEKGKVQKGFNISEKVKLAADKLWKKVEEIYGLFYQLRPQPMVRHFQPVVGLSADDGPTTAFASRKYTQRGSRCSLKSGSGGA